MPKSNTNESNNSVPPNAQPTIHLILQGKGGVGNSLVASWLAEFLLHRGQPVRCIDGDTVNRSFGQFKAFAAEKLDLLNRDGVLKRTKYDVLINRVLTEDAVFVVDSGATAFMPFWTYLAETDAVRILQSAGRRVYIHMPISAGEMLSDTLLGFNTVAATATERNIVARINEYFGRVESEGKTFDQMQVYIDNQDKSARRRRHPGKNARHLRHVRSPHEGSEANFRRGDRFTPGRLDPTMRTDLHGS